jgi:hypothetical protein
MSSSLEDKALREVKVKIKMSLCCFFLLNTML